MAWNKATKLRLIRYEGEEPSAEWRRRGNPTQQVGQSNFAKRNRTPWKASLHSRYTSCRAWHGEAPLVTTETAPADDDVTQRVELSGFVTRDGDGQSKELALVTGLM